MWLQKFFNAFLVLSCQRERFKKHELKGSKSKVISYILLAWLEQSFSFVFDSSLGWQILLVSLLDGSLTVGQYFRFLSYHFHLPEPSDSGHTWVVEWNEWIRPVSLFYFIWLTLKFPAWWLSTTSIDHFSAKWQPILWGGAENPPLWAGFWDADPSTNSVPHRHIFRPGQHVGWEFSQSHRKKIWPQRPEATHGHLSSNLHTTKRNDKHWGSVLHLLNSSLILTQDNEWSEFNCMIECWR